jgi:hypothetical protein
LISSLHDRMHVILAEKLAEVAREETAIPLRI